MRRLRTVVEKWLALAPATPVRVTRVAVNAERRQSVCVEADSPRGPVSLHFFRHSDGAWQVFPPKRIGLMMHAHTAVIE